MRLIDPKKIPKMGEPTTLKDTPMYEFAQCLVDYLVENYGVDVPDIVRCKDCKRYMPYRNIKGGEMGEGECEGYDPCVPANHYCSRGERKNG